MSDYKGTCSRLVKVVYNFFLPQTFIQQQYEAIFKQNDHFQTHCAWDRATQHLKKEKINKRMLYLIEKFRVIFLFPHNCITLCL